MIRARSATHPRATIGNSSTHTSLDCAIHELTARHDGDPLFQRSVGPTKKYVPT